MAIYPTAPSAASAEPTPVDIEAWTEQAAQALSAVTISGAITTTTTTAAAAAPTPLIRGTAVTLDIPLDDHHNHTVQPGASAPGTNDTSAGQAARTGYVRRREPLRRDSLKRREALLKGKEGSRRRQRWENGP